MSHDIKQLKPTKYGRYEQGYINNSACKKLFPSLRNQPIIFRSSYERKLVTWFESNENVKYWGSECVKIPYMYIDKCMHTYYPDYFVQMTDGSYIMIEVKPKSQTVKPKEDDNWAYNTYIKNLCKWKAAKKYCEDRNIKFQILTEKTIEKLC